MAFWLCAYAHNETDFIFLVITSFESPHFFPARMNALLHTWGYRFPYMTFLGIDTPFHRKRLVDEFQCIPADAPDGEFMCFNPPARIVLLANCTDDGHTPVGTGCKCQQGLLHVLNHRTTWLQHAKWIAVLDDDVFIWVDQFLPWMSKVPSEGDVVVQPQGSIHAICPGVPRKPLIPVMSMFGMISKSLLQRHESALRANAIVQLANEWNHLHDITWGLILYNLQPYRFVRLPFCDDRTGGCTNRVLLVHAVHVVGEGEASPYCHKNFGQREYAEMYACFKTDALAPPEVSVENLRSGAPPLLLKEQCMQ